MPPDRISTALAHTEFALRHLPSISEPGKMSGRLAAEWRKALTEEQLCMMLVVAAQASLPADLDQLGFILGGPIPMGGA